MSDTAGIPGSRAGEDLTDAPAGYGGLRPLWEDEIGIWHAAQSTAGGPEVGLRLLRVRVAGRAERRRLRGACLAVTALTPCTGILTVHEAAFTTGDHPYLVTDRPRDTLAGRLAADGPLDVPVAAAIGQALAATLSAAHDRGILHQDVRPGTVVWGAGPDPLLADFGVTQAALAAGAVELPPQALVHAAREVFGWETPGPAADVHGLASTIYTMLAGQPPYHAEALLGRAALYQRVLRGAPPPIAVPGVPARLSALLADMMAPDPASRPALHEVTAALAAAGSPPRHGVAQANPIAVSPAAVSPAAVSSVSAAAGIAAGGPGAEISAAAGPQAIARAPGRPRSRYAVLALLLAIGVVALLAGIVWGVVTAPGQSPRPTASASPGPQATAAITLSPAQQASFRPRQVTVTQASAGIRVSWSAPVIAAGVTGYVVIAERGGQPVQERTLAPSRFGATFTGLPSGQQYCFVVGSLLQAASGQPLTAAAPPACTQ